MSRGGFGLMEPKVSVIVPVYNLEDYIERCVESIISQTYTNIEIILINDGSVDSSLEKCMEYAKKDNRIIVLDQKNKGVSAARNLGLDKATGKYVTFVDGDDCIHGKYIEILISGFNNANVIFSYCNSAVSYSMELYFRITETIEDITHFAYTQRLLLGKSPEQGACAKLFIREKIGELRFIEGKKYHEDTYFTFLYLNKNCGEVAHFVSDLYIYYMRDLSASHSKFSLNNLSEIYFADEILSLVLKTTPELKDYAGYHYISARLAVLKNICRSKGLNQHLDLCKSIRKEILLCNYKNDFTKIRKIECISLKVGLRFYAFMVRLFDILK